MPAPPSRGEETRRKRRKGEWWREKDGERRRCSHRAGEDRTLTPWPPAATGPRRAVAPGLSNPWRRVPWDQHEGGGLPTVGQRPPVEAAGCVCV